jgi:hypothetical protein
VKTTTKAIAVRCASCSKRAMGYLHTVQFPELPGAAWLRMPAGWWVLLVHRLVDDPSDEPHARCPKCLKGANLKRARSV